MDPRTTKLANVLVNYSCKVKKGDKLLVEMNGFEPVDLAAEIVRIATKKGAYVFYNFRHDTLHRALLMNANEDQIKAQKKYPLFQMKDMDCYIGVRAGDNIAETSDVPSIKTGFYAKHYGTPVHMKVRVPKTRWVVLRYPNNSMAQNARKPLSVFEDFYYDVCTMDYAKMSRAMNPLAKLMNKTDQVHIKAPGTNLSFSIKELISIKCDGEVNIPDGECFTAPVKDSVEGTVCFNAGSLLEGTAFEAINLTFKNGKVIKAESGANTKKLNEILDRDKGSRYVGEFALGFNPFITAPMLDILFDEKIAGSFHMALGNAYDECRNGNVSALHWDLVQIQTPKWGGGEIWFDGKLIRKNGKFVPKSLQGLNPENLK